MINAEKYKTEIARIRNLDKEFCLVNGRIQACQPSLCDKCEFEGNCEYHRREWLWEEEKVDIETVMQQFNGIIKHCEDIKAYCKEVIRLLKEVEK